MQTAVSDQGPPPKMRDLGFLNIAETAALLDVTPGTLANWRAENRGPSFTRIGRGIFYSMEALKNFIAANAVDTNCSAPTLARDMNYRRGSARRRAIA